MLRPLLVIALALVAITDCAPGLAADPLGFYAGAAVGQADVRSNEASLALFGTAQGTPLNQHATGWNLLLGVRPISLIGAELEYADFGHPSTVTPLNIMNIGARTDAHPRAAILSGLIYAPIPLPFFDLYGKVGISSLRTDVHTIVVCTATPCPPIVFIAPFALDKTTANFSYAAGAQLKFSALAVRLEYERIKASGGDPDLLSIGLAWAF